MADTRVSQIDKWLKGLPEDLKALARAWPPNAVVKPKRLLLIPGPGELATVIGYESPDSHNPEGRIFLQGQSGFKDHRAYAEPAWLDIHRYDPNFLPDRVALLLGARRHLIDFRFKMTDN